MSYNVNDRVKAVDRAYPVDRGDGVMVNCMGEPGTVIAVVGDGTYEVTFDYWKDTQTLPESKLEPGT